MQKTLGEKLAPSAPDSKGAALGTRVRRAIFNLLNVSLLTAMAVLPLWWFLASPEIEIEVLLALLAALFVGLVLIYSQQHTPKPHFLLFGDHQGFVRDLRLDAKTALIDGSNIYHFGHRKGLDAQPLGEIAHMLRTEGYRVICFFDANIYHTLNEHGAFPNTHRHSLGLLTDIFGLQADEIYVVPSGIQADKYILETLKHMPISFAVTNDLFRDYATQYQSVMKDSQWRKGVVLEGNTIRIQNITFKAR